MTEPLKPTNYINIGGVKFNSNDIDQQQTLIKENGAIRYSVFLRNGVHLEFPKQKAENNASVFPDDSLTDKFQTWTNINNLAYGQVKGTEKSDVIRLSGNNGTTVDISGEKNKEQLGDQVIIHDTVKGQNTGDGSLQKNFVPSQNNKIITSEKDYINIETQNAKVELDGKGYTTESSLKGIKQEK